MKITPLVLGAFQTNTYLLTEGEHALIVDPAGRFERIAKALSQENKVDGILLTHGHFDHIKAADEAADTYHCPIYLHPADRVLVRDSSLNSMSGYTAQVRHSTLPLKEGRMQCGPFVFEVIEMPGHTPGSVMFQFEHDLFCGDVLFAGSIGRCDLPLGNFSQMRQSLRRFTHMDPSLRVYPGHGPFTELAVELKTNPYL